MAPQNSLTMEDIMSSYMNSFFDNGIQRLENKKNLLENGHLALDCDKDKPIGKSNGYNNIVNKDIAVINDATPSRYPHQLKPVQYPDQPSYVSVTDGSDCPIIIVGKDGKIRKIYPSAQQYTPRNATNPLPKKSNHTYLYHNGPIIREITDEDEKDGKNNFRTP